MNDKPRPRGAPDFIQSLIAMMRHKGMQIDEFQVQPDGSIEPVKSISDKEALRLIHDKVNLDLVNALQQWFVSQDTTMLEVFASTAYFLAYELYRETETEEEVCIVSDDYGRYIHATTHLLYRHNGPPKKED